MGAAVKCPKCPNEMFEFDTWWMCVRGCGHNINKLAYEEGQDLPPAYHKSSPAHLPSLRWAVNPRPRGQVSV